MRVFISVLTFTCMAHLNAQELTFPYIKNYGGIVEIEESVKPTQGAKIAIDLTELYPDGETGVSRNIDRVARLINLYAYSGIDPKELTLRVILHGPATNAILSDEAYQAKFETVNPNTELLQVLADHDVELIVCGQSFLRRGYQPEDLNANVKIGISAITTVAESQVQGYVLLPY